MNRSSILIKPGRIVLAFVACCAGLWLNAMAAVEGPGDALFTNDLVHRFDVEVTSEGLASLRIAPRVYVPASVRFRGQLYTNVGVHLKGVATFRPVDDQPSLTLKFDKFDKRQRFHGLRKIHLNNGKEDPTYLCEAISAEMFANAGLPVARVALAQTRLNGRNLGPYVVIEGFTEEFLARYFRNTNGNLYDSGFRHDITYPLEKLMGKKPHDWADLRKLAAAAAVPDLQRRWVALGSVLDTNSFARYLAMQVLTVNWDGYALFQNNYRVYHDPESQRFFFFPHGMDQMFSRPNAPAMPRWNGLVARAFMETPQGQALYRKHLMELFARVYRTTELAGRVDVLAGLVRPLIAEQNVRAAVDYDQRVKELRGRIVLRGEFLKQQLATTNWVNPPARR